MDILYQQRGPMLEVMAHNGSINCLAVHDNGGLICIGKDDGPCTTAQVTFVSCSKAFTDLAVGSAPAVVDDVVVVNNNQK